MGKRFIHHDRVVLTNAQIKALVTTGITVAAAPGAGKMNKFIDATISVDAQAGAYTNIDAAATVGILCGAQAVSQRVNNAVGTLVATLLATTTDVVVAHMGVRDTPYFTLAEGTPNTIAAQTNNIGAVETKTLMANKALVIKATNAAAGDFTGGNAANTATVDVFYTVIPI